MSDVQAYLRTVVADGHQLVSSGPFHVFLAPDSDHPYFNYAIPRDGAEPTDEQVRELAALMAGAGRIPRLEYLPAEMPAVEPVLVAAGFAVERRVPVMTCARGTAVEVALPDRVTLHQVGPEAEGEEVHGLLRALAEAFGEPYYPVKADAAAASLQRRIAVIAYADGEVAGGGSCQAIIGGATELVGIGVLEAHRRRGIAGAVTAELARLAFARGARTAFLTPGDEATARVYERAGFERTDTMLHLRMS